MHTPDVDARLPAALHASTLLYVLPRTNTIASFARKLQTQLKTAEVPKIMAQPSGALIDGGITSEEAFWLHAPAGKDRLRVKLAWTNRAEDEILAGPWRPTR